MNLHDKKLISLRISEDLIRKIDTLRPKTRLHNRTEMFEHAVSLYIAYVNHQLEQGDNFE